MSPMSNPTIPQEILQAIAQAEARDASEDPELITLEKFRREILRTVPELLHAYIQINEGDLDMVNCNDIAIKAFIPCLAPLEIHLIRDRNQLMLANDYSEKFFNYRIPQISLRHYAKIDTFPGPVQAFVTNDLDIALLTAKNRHEQFVELDDNSTLRSIGIEAVYGSFSPES